MVQSYESILDTITPKYEEVEDVVINHNDNFLSTYKGLMYFTLFLLLLPIIFILFNIFKSIKRFRYN